MAEIQGNVTPEETIGGTVYATALSSEQNAEIIDARKAFDGSTFKSLGEAIRTQVTDLWDAIPVGILPQSKSGAVITVDDADDTPLHSLKLYGKTIQNGTPTPEVPVALESAGADGSIAINVCGKNLVNVFTDDLNYKRDGTKQTSNKNVVNEDGSVTVNVPSSATYGIGFIKSLPAGKSVVISYDVESLGNGTMIHLVIYDVNNYQSSLLNHATEYTGTFKRTFTPAVSGRYMFGWHVKNGTAPCGAKITNLQLEFSDGTITEYEVGKATQTLTAQTPNGLSGIPVSSGGNYTDENGQMWICDEIDFARGKYIQRVRTAVFNGDEPWQFVQSSNAVTVGLYPYSPKSGVYCLCSHYVWSNSNAVFPRIGIYSALNIYDKTIASLDDWKARITADPITVLYQLATPIETDLTTEEIAQYTALHTNYPNTTIYNDSGADMEVNYFTPNSTVPMNIGGGAKGKVLGVDEHGCIVPKSVIEMGSAPAGHGLGTQVSELSNPDDARLNGWYRVPYPSEVGIPTKGMLRVDGENDAYFNQTMMANAGNNYDTLHELKRVFNGSFQPWEWVNPPMQQGVEYRTTERCEGRPVYTKRVPCGTAPNASSKTVTLVDTNTTRIVRWSGYVDYSGIALPTHDSRWLVGISWSPSIGFVATITTINDESNSNVFIQIYYTKD